MIFLSPNPGPIESPPMCIYNIFKRRRRVDTDQYSTPKSVTNEFQSIIHSNSQSNTVEDDAQTPKHNLSGSQTNRLLVAVVNWSHLRWLQVHPSDTGWQTTGDRCRCVFCCWHHVHCLRLNLQKAVAKK